MRITKARPLAASRGCAPEPDIGSLTTIRSYRIQDDRMAAPVVAAREADLTAAARIRNAALRHFAARGVAATSIRDVARAARVSPGLVQHHFRAKARLRRAVDEFVIRRALEAFGIPISGGPPRAIALQLGSRIAEFIRANPDVFAYMVDRSSRRISPGSTSSSACSCSPARSWRDSPVKGCSARISISTGPPCR